MSKDKEKKERGKKALGNILKFLVLPIVLTIIFNWKIGLGLFGIFFAWSIIKIRRRKYFTKDISGEKLEFKQFMTRWKEGIEGITPLQQAKTNLLGTWITLSGILSGIIINALVRMENQWIWIEVILVGSLVLVIIQMIGGFQKFWRFKETDKIQKQFEKELKEDLEQVELVEPLKEEIEEDKKIEEVLNDMVVKL